MPFCFGRLGVAPAKPLRGANPSPPAGLWGARGAGVTPVVKSTDRGHQCSNMHSGDLRSPARCQGEARELDCIVQGYSSLSDKVATTHCKECKQHLVEIDNRGRLLRGCATCNVWWPLEGGVNVKLSVEDLQAIQQLRRTPQKRSPGRVRLPGLPRQIGAHPLCAGSGVGCAKPKLRSAGEVPSERPIVHPPERSDDRLPELRRFHARVRNVASDAPANTPPALLGAERRLGK